VSSLGSDRPGKDLDASGKNELEAASAGHPCGEGDHDLIRTDGADQWVTYKLTGFDPRLLAAFELVEGKRNSGNSGKNGQDRE